MADTNNGRLSFVASLDTSQLRNDAAAAKALFDGVASNAEQKGNAIERSFQRIGTAAAGIFAVSQIQQYIGQVAHVRGEFQQLEIAFTTMLGSVEQANSLMAQITRTAMVTPFGLTDLASASKQLLAYGLEADKVNDTLIRMGDIAAGLSIPIGDLAYLYGTTMVQGRMYTQDLNQFLNRGIPIMESLASQLGVTKDKVRELVQEGKVGFPQIEQAFIDLTSEGSKFGGLMEEQSRSITGVISNIEDALDNMMNDIGKASQDEITGALDIVKTLAENWRTVGSVLATVIATYGAYKAAVAAVNIVARLNATLTAEAALQMRLAATQGIALSQAQALAAAKTNLLTLAMNGLKAAIASNPIGTILTVVGAAISAFVMWQSTIKTTEDYIEDLNTVLGDDIARIKERTAEGQKMVDVAANENASSEDRRAAMAKILLLYPSLLDKYADEYDMLAHIADVKREIAAIDKADADNAVERQITSIDERISVLNKALSSGNVGFTSRDEHAELDALKQQRYTLTEKMRKDAAEQFFANLTGISNDDLDAMIRQRQALLAKMDVKGLTSADAKGTFITGADVTQGTFTRREIEGQAAALTAEKNRREAPRQSTAQFVAQAKAAYTQAQEDLEDFLTSTTESLTKEEFDKRLKTLQEAVSSAKKTYDTVKGSSSSRKTADITAQRLQEIEDYGIEVAEATRQMELDIEQARIDGMDEGLDKSMAQVALNYDKMMDEVERKRDDMLDALADVKTTEWALDTPQATQVQQTAMRSSIRKSLTTADLSEGQQAALTAYEQQAEAARIRGNKQALDAMLADVLTYEQQRERIAEVYARRKASLYTKDASGNATFTLVDGVTEGNVENLEAEEQDALNAVDEQFARKEATYRAWCRQVASMTLAQLEDVLTKAQAELSKVEGTEGVSDADIAVARAKVTTAQQAVTDTKAKVNANEDNSPKKDWEEGWKALAQQINSCAAEFDNIGQAIGGAAGEVFSFMGQITASATSMINGILTLANGTSTALAATATSAAAAISVMEKASAVLTIISAALTIANLIAGLFNDDEEKQEEIERLQNRIDQLQWEVDHIEYVRMSNAGLDVFELLNDTLKETRHNLAQTALAVGNVSLAYTYLFQNVKDNEILLEQTASALADVYANLDYTANKALGEEKYNEARSQLESIAQQQLLIQEQIAQEEARKNTDESTIADLEQEIAELAEDAAEIINELVEDIMGDTAENMAQTLGDAIFEAFEDGTDYAEAWGDAVNDIISDIIKNMVVEKFLEEEIGNIFDKYKAEWFTDGNFNGIDTVLATIDGLHADLTDVGESFAAIWEELSDTLGDYFDVDRTGVSTGIAQASQDSVDELNGRMTAVQSHTYSINEATKAMSSTLSSVLAGILTIADNTDGLSKRAKTIEGYTKEFRDTLNNISTNGIKIK